MRLTIIPIDGAVYENELCYSGLVWEGTPLDIHALQWLDNSGWIEFNDGKTNESITELPQWALNAEAAWQIAYNQAHADPLPPTAEQNKETASKKLYDTDWTTIPDVSDSAKSNPYLINVDEFVAYRNTIRQYAVNPVEGYINWAVQPIAIWSS